jgi:hypothetical protein
MVFFFIADLALSIAIKATTWCLGKTYDGIVYLVTRKSKKNDDEDGDEFVVISLEDYRALRGKRRTIKAEPTEPTATHRSEELDSEPVSSLGSSSK